jgi:hypothetical protein
MRAISRSRLNPERRSHLRRAFEGLLPRLGAAAEVTAAPVAARRSLPTSAEVCHCASESGSSAQASGETGAGLNRVPSSPEQTSSDLSSDTGSRNLSGSQPGVSTFKQARTLASLEPLRPSGGKPTPNESEWRVGKAVGTSSGASLCRVEQVPIPGGGSLVDRCEFGSGDQKVFEAGRPEVCGYSGGVLPLAMLANRIDGDGWCDERSVCSYGLEVFAEDEGLLLEIQ